MINTTLRRLIQHALSLSKISLSLGVLAIGCFLIFGTLASLTRFHQHTLLYYAFYYLPYILIGLSVPISLYHAFLIHRYRLIQPSILSAILLLAIIFSIIMPFIGAVAWLAMPFLFKTTLKRFLAFLTTHQENTQ